MPFPLIPTALGLCFLLVWAFIAGMIFRDGQIAARDDREQDMSILPLPTSRIPSSALASRPAGIRRHNRSIRAAS
jgi:hypothetical protein